MPFPGRPVLPRLNSSFCRLISRRLSTQQCEDALSHYNEEIRRTGVGLMELNLIPPIFKACANLQSLNQGIPFHAAVIKKGVGTFTSIGNSILSFYFKCDMVKSALRVFECLVDKDSVTWNAMIHGFLCQGCSEEGLGLFMQARGLGFEPNLSSFILVIQACWMIKAVYEGLYVHCLVLRNGLLFYASVRNSLLSMYTKYEDMRSAQRMFDEMPIRDVISWSVLIGGYIQSGEAKVALQLFRDMSSGGSVAPDGTTVVGVLQSCSRLGDIKQGRLIHGLVIFRGLNADIFVGNSLVDMYSNCLDVESSYKVFNEMSHKNTVSWNSILSGFVNSESYSEALALFNSMKMSGFATDEVTLVNLLQACKNLGQAIMCKCIHVAIMRRSFESNVMVVNSLLDAYLKCYLPQLALNLFEQMEKKNLVSWSTMIAGYTHCGMPNEAITLFGEMLMANEKPNSVTFLNLLKACSASTELRPSQIAHGLAIRNGMAKDLAIGTALLDMYGKCGEIDMSRKVFNHMPNKNVVSCSAMIRAYGMNGRARDALALFHEMELMGPKPNSVTMLSVLSACSHGGLVEEGSSCFRGMANNGFGLSREHYSCMVDMLGRAGEPERAIEVIKKMPEGLEVGASAWGALLSTCTRQGNCAVGEGVAARVIELEPTSSSGYLLASSMYARCGLRYDTARMRSMMKENGVRVMSGYSLVHVDQRTSKFVAGNTGSEDICNMIEQLHCRMKTKHITLEAINGESM